MRIIIIIYVLYRVDRKGPSRVKKIQFIVDDIDNANDIVSNL